MGVFAYLPFALLLNKAYWKQILLGYGLILLVALGTFAPQLKTIVESWDHATLRTRVVSAFSLEGEYLGDSTTHALLGHQFLRNVRGFFLMDTDVMAVGLWGRYIPPGRAFLDLGTSVFFWIGLVASWYYWRRTLLWWTMLLALLVPQVLSLSTPNAARGVLAAPFLYLFVGLGIHAVFIANSYLLQRLRLPSFAPAIGVVAILPLFAFIAWSNGNDYFDWIQKPYAIRLREPAVEAKQFSHWQELAREAAREGRLLSGEEWLQAKSER